MAEKPKSDGRDDVATYFDGAAVTFDTFYDRKRSRFMQWVDRKFRSDMFERFRRTFEALDPLRGKTVLDVGCGSGPYLVEAVRRGAQRVVGLDMAAGMIRLAQERAEAAGATDRCEFRLGTFPDDAPDEPFNYAIVMGVMDYVADPEAFLTALAKVVTEKAVLSFPSTHWFRTPLRKVRYWIKRCPLYFHDRDAIEAMVRKAGFKDVRITKIPGAGMDYVVIGCRGEQP